MTRLNTSGWFCREYSASLATSAAGRAGVGRTQAEHLLEPARGESPLLEFVEQVLGYLRRSCGWIFEAASRSCGSIWSGETASG